MVVVSELEDREFNHTHGPWENVQEYTLDHQQTQVRYLWENEHY